MLLKIRDTFYLRAKACILCFDMVILIGVVGRRVERDGKGVRWWWWGGVDLSLSFLSLSLSPSIFAHLSFALPVSGNTGILNGFPVLQLRPHPTPPHRPPPCSAISGLHLLPALFSSEPPLHCALFPPPTNQYLVLPLAHTPRHSHLAR